MRKIILFTVFVLMGCVHQLRANHVFGGELYYTYISGNTYKVELVLYGDCASASGAYPGLFYSSPTIVLKNKINGNFVSYSDIKLDIQQPIGEEITPLCPSQLNNSSCNSGTLPGVRKFVYSKTTTLPALGPNYTEWRFEFHGDQNDPPNSFIAGRSTLITNIAGAGTNPTILNLRAYLNRNIGENNSPRYTSLPTPFYCVNKDQTYNIGAVDTSIDDLSFALVPALDNDGLSTVTYVTGYTATNPISVNGNLTFSNTSGQLDFQPNQVQNSVVVYEVTEKRNGQIVGTSMREMTFVVLNNCNNTPPEDSLTSPDTNVVIINNEIRGCEGIPLDIDFGITDIDQNNVTVSYSNLPPGAIFTIFNNSSTNPTAKFQWSNPVAGTYLFYVTYLDDGCPLAVRQTKAYTIKILNLDDPIVSVTDPTDCVHRATVKFEFPGIATYGPVRLNVYDQNGNLIITQPSLIGNYIDSLFAGSYTMQTVAPNGCASDVVPFTINDEGDYPFQPVVTSPIYYCKYDPAVPLTATSFGPYNSTLRWYSPTGVLLNSAPTPSTTSTGSTTYTVTQKYGNCESLPVPIEVKVSQAPGNNILIPQPICQYDTILVKFTGAYLDSNDVNITWDFSSAVVVDSGNTFGEVYITFPFSGTFTIGISAISETICQGTANMQQVSILPNAITRLSGDTSTCQYEPIQISNVMPITPASTYTWDADGGTILSQNSTNAVFVYDTPGWKTISITAANANCSHTSYHRIYVFPKPDIRLNIDNNTEICLGDSIIIRVDSGSKVTFEPQVFVRQDDDSSNVYYLIIVQPTQFTIYAEGEGGCMDTASILVDNIKDCCKYFIPTAFTPNGDGLNDQFDIWFKGNPKNYALRIYNRWGETIFKSFNKHDSWDGLYRGEAVDVGVYFYMLEGECYENNQEIRESGDVTILR